MQKIDVTLETMTPLFLGGAGGKTAPPELRPPAFRGAMRYWLRAALGGIIGDDENAMKTIVQLEGKVFGSVREESSNAASEIVTRIANSQMMPYITYQR